MAQLMKGHEALGRIIDALGLKGQSVNKVVIVCAVNEAVQVYVKRYVREQEMDALCDNLVEPSTRAPGEVEVTTVRGLEVDQMGRVYVPAQEHARLRRALEHIAQYDPDGAQEIAIGALGRLDDEGHNPEVT